jgi:hypothetical protein
MNIAIWPVLLIIIGLLLWLIPGRAKREMAGFVCFCIGLGGLTLVLLHHVVKVG